MNRKEADRAKLEGLIAPPPGQTGINNYYSVEKRISHPAAWIIGGIALPVICAAFLWGMESGYSRASSDVATAQSEAAIARAKVEQVKACVEAIK